MTTITRLTNDQLPPGWYRMMDGYHEGADYYLVQSAPFKGISFWRVRDGLENS